MFFVSIGATILWGVTYGARCIAWGESVAIVGDDMRCIRRLSLLVLVVMVVALCGCGRSVSSMRSSLGENIDNKNLNGALADSAALMKKDKAEFINAISSRDMNSLDSIFYFLMAKATFERNKDESLEWFFTAYLCGMYDAYRCEDKTARQGVLVIMSTIPEVVQYALDFSKKEPDKFSKIVSRSIHRADSYHLIGDPNWVCGHGIKSFNGQTPQLLPESDWEAIYADQREALVKSANVKEVQPQN
jgi:hypothetical protein